jgi:aspartyl-tRNA(Asn)/glutamyl-tRNA(Gln) amidotransferase subunit B
MEVVTEPDLHSADQARDYALALRQLLRYVGASEADMEKGQLRVEPNISVRRRGTEELGVKTELKNLNSFRALHLAIQHEVERQVRAIEAGGEVVQETRGWSEAERRTFSQRTKEFAEDYRYFPEPDIPPLELDPAWIERLRAELPELPAARRARLVEQYGLSAQDATDLAAERETADYFEAVVGAGAEAKPAANWVVQERPVIPAERLAALVKLVVAGRINRDQGRLVLQEATQADRDPEEIVRERGLEQLSDESDLAAAVDRVIAENPQAVADFQAGNQRAIGALLGAVKAATGGRANMALVSSLLRDRLNRAP